MQHRKMNVPRLDLDLEGYEPKGWRPTNRREARPRYRRGHGDSRKCVLKACKLYVYGVANVTR
jgi:hypothetical protein